MVLHEPYEAVLVLVVGQQVQPYLLGRTLQNPVVQSLVVAVVEALLLQ